MFLTLCLIPFQGIIYKSVRSEYITGEAFNLQWVLGRGEKKRRKRRRSRREGRGEDEGEKGKQRGGEVQGAERRGGKGKKKEEETEARKGNRTGEKRKAEERIILGKLFLRHHLKPNYLLYGYRHSNPQFINPQIKTKSQVISSSK